MLFFILLFAGFVTGHYHLTEDTDTPKNEIKGVWVTADGAGHIKIDIENDELTGVIIWAEDMYEEDGVTLTKDSNNPEPELRNRTIKGLQIISGFKLSNGEWRGGRIYDPENGREYRGRIRLENDTLRLRGYVGISAFGRTEVWTRLED